MDELKTRIKRYWNWRSESYGFDHDKSIETVKSWEIAINSLANNSKGRCALDVGTGTGQLALYLSRSGFDVTGVDISASMIECAVKKAAECRLPVDFRTGDAEQLDFNDNTFDVVVSRNLIWTLPDPEKAMNEWHRVLKPEGRIIISDGFWENQTWSHLYRFGLKLFKGMFKNGSLVSFRFFLHYAGLLKSLPLYEGVRFGDVDRLMQKAGFEIISSYDTRRHFSVNPYASNGSAAPPFFIAYADK
jgi:ubiquinone/menaquinone biosynthesis C-methylase UbiE